MPYPNEHACRLRDPDEFEEGSFRRIQVGSGDNEHSAIIGRLKGKTRMTIQALRYNKKNWTNEAARASCKRHSGRFEAARDD
jgi:hypothetical protein